MSQLARRENAPHRAAFVTSLSRWYIRRLLGNLPPFHPCLSAERRPRICPLRDFATLRTYSPEIKARQALFAFLPVYPELVGLIGWNVPNYQGVFLRGYGSQTSYHYGAVGHWSAGLGELQGDGIREISAAFSTGGQHGIGGASGSFGVTGGQGYDWKYGGTGNTYWGGIDFYASRVTPVVGEIRPVNRAVRYLIRAR